jgi:hypothetical protein
LTFEQVKVALVEVRAGEGVTDGLAVADGVAEGVTVGAGVTVGDGAAKAMGEMISSRNSEMTIKEKLWQLRMKKSKAKRFI